MTRGSTSGYGPGLGGHRYLLLAAAVASYLLVTMGGVVCVTGAARGCPDWPGCYGQILPPARTDAIIEFLHRFTAIVAGPLIIVSAVIGWRRFRSMPWVARPPMIAVVLTVAVVIFGAFAVLTGLPPVIAAIDFGSALSVLALMVTAAVAAFQAQGRPSLPAGMGRPVAPDRLRFQTPLARLAILTVGTTFVVFVSGIFVGGGSASLARCLGWPLYGTPLGAGGASAWLQVVRWVLGGGATVLVAAIVVQAWRSRGLPAALKPVAVALGALLLAETLADVVLVVAGPITWLLAVYVALAAAVWALLVAAAVLAGSATSSEAEIWLRVAQPARS